MSILPGFRPRKDYPCFFVIVFLVTLLFWAAFFSLRLDVWQRVQQPLVELRGDGFTVLMGIKGLIDKEWVPFLGVHTMRLGAPFGQDQADNPGPDNLYNLILKILSWFSSNPFLILNFYFFLTYLLTALSMFVLCRCLRVSQLSAIAISVLYAFLPFHFMRINHLFLASYFLIPLMIWFLLLLWRKVPLINRKRLRDWKWVVSFLFIFLLFGSGGLYYCFFFCFLSLTLSLSAAIYRKSWAPIQVGMAYAGVTLAGVALNSIPTILAIARHSRNGAIANRNPAESEIYGLKLVNLVMPTQSHRWAFLQSLRDTYTWGTPYVEGYDEYAGLVALFGLLLLLFNLLKPNSSATLQRKLALIVMMGFLLSTIGGLGTLIANWIRPEFRSLNRISIFLCTCGLLSSALAIDSMKRKRSKRIFAEVVFLILLLGMWDQCPRMMKVREDGIKAHLDDTSFFASLENLLPREAMVLQLPFMEFPESPPYYKMGDYEHLVGYLYTKQLRFSYGAIKGREGSETLKKWSTFPFNISFLKEKGFKAIYLDRFGFRDGGSLIQELLTRKIGAPKLSSGDGRRVCWIL